MPVMMPPVPVSLLARQISRLIDAADPSREQSYTGLPVAVDDRLDKDKSDGAGWLVVRGGFVRAAVDEVVVMASVCVCVLGPPLVRRAFGDDEFPGRFRPVSLPCVCDAPFPLPRGVAGCVVLLRVGGLILWMQRVGVVVVGVGVGVRPLAVQR